MDYGDINIVSLSAELSGNALTWDQDKKLIDSGINVSDLQTQVQTVSGDAIIVPLRNTYHVAKSGDDSTADGSVKKPFQTISAALADIGSATTTVEFQDFDQSSFVIKVSPGIYTENITIPDRQVFNIHLQGGARIVGDINFPASTALGGSSHPPKLCITGETNKTGFGGNVPIIGIIGDIFFGNESTQKVVAILDLRNIYVQGNIISAVALTGGGGRHNQLYGTNLAVEGTIRNSTNTTAYLSIYVHNTDWNDSPHSIGQIGASGFNNNMRLKSFSNVEVNGKVFANTSFKDWRLKNVIFNDEILLDGATSFIQADSVSYSSLVPNLSGANTATIELLDTDLGVKNTSVVSGTSVKDALDNLQQTISSFTRATDYTVVSGDYGAVLYLTGSGNLFLPASPLSNSHVWLKNIGSSTITVDGNGNNIEGISTQPLSVDDSFHLHWNGTQWYII